MKYILLESQIIALKESVTMLDIINKKVGDVFPNSPFSIHDRTITYAKFFKGGETEDDSFKAVRNAENFLDSEGYSKGSMESNNPIFFIKAGKLGVNDLGSSIMTVKGGEERAVVITKWSRLTIDNINNDIDGVLLSDDFRDGDVQAIFFTFPD